MVGNVFGTSLAMIPGLVVAQSCRFVDLDGPLHLQQDRENGLRYANGEVTLPDCPVWGGTPA